MKKDGAQPHSEAFYTVEEYLSFDKASELRNEYMAGQIVAMTGASREHNLVNSNVSRELNTQLRGKPCETYSNDMRVQTKAPDYYYPDTVVVCGEPQLIKPEGVDTLLNPTVIIEVLSKSSEADDRGGKFIEYRTLASLKDYILISQNKMRVEHYARQPDDKWTLVEDASSGDQTIRIESINCELSLADIYERVEFPPPRQLRRVSDETPPQ